MQAPELRGSLANIRYPAFCETKLDGEFCFIHYVPNKRGEQIWTVNKYGTSRDCFKALRQIWDILRKNSVFTSQVFLAELFHGSGMRGSLYDLNSNKKSDDLHLCIFDVFDQTKSLLDRKELLFEMIGPNQIQPIVIMDRPDAEVQFKLATSKGYEGIVLKPLDSPLVLGPCSWVKMKYKDRNELFVGMVDLHKERIEVIHPTGTVGVAVGVKAPNRYKKHIKAGDVVTIEHQGVLPSGSLRHPVLIAKKEWK